jgi:hypothetical protein
MTNAPERIWINAWGGNWSPVSGGTQEIQYTRTDLIAAMIEEAVQAEREACAVMFDELAKDEDALSDKYRGGSNPWFAHVQTAKMKRRCAAAIRARKGDEACPVTHPTAPARER